MKQDWKKADKQYYLPKTKPDLVKVPPFKFFSIMDKVILMTNPFRRISGYFIHLRTLSKCLQKTTLPRKDYFEYTVYPLEGIWDLTEEAKKSNSKTLDKSQLVFNLNDKTT